MKTILTLKDIVAYNGVRNLRGVLTSNKVYPDFTKHTNHGEIDQTVTNALLKPICEMIDGIQSLKDYYVINKYAIPVFFTESVLKDITVFYVYQHDEQTLLISETTKATK